jgi:hypothetical protein
MFAPQARPILMALSTAVALGDGKDPGMPRHTGQIKVLGSAPNSTRQPQNILVFVESWACTSSPMTML